MQSNIDFRLMSIEYRLRDCLRPPINMLQEAGVRSGMTILDFGCGPGGFSLAAARLVGPRGQVYAVDIHPLAIQSVQRRMHKQGLCNIQTVCGNELATIPGRSSDIILIYDVLHDLSDPGLTLTELHRLLRTDGLLSVSDHHLKEASLTAIVTGDGLYHVTSRSRHSLQFGRIAQPREGA